MPNLPEIDAAVPELTVAQIREQMRLAVNRVMAEGSLYDPDLAALAIREAGLGRAFLTHEVAGLVHVHHVPVVVLGEVVRRAVGRQQLPVERAEQCSHSSQVRQWKFLAESYQKDYFSAMSLDVLQLGKSWCYLLFDRCA